MLLGQEMYDEIMSVLSISIDLNSGNTCQISQVHWTKLGRTHNEGTLLKTSEIPILFGPHR